MVEAGCSDSDHEPILTILYYSQLIEFVNNHHSVTLFNLKIAISHSCKLVKATTAPQSIVIDIDRQQETSLS
jgi:hypothetical protein